MRSAEKAHHSTFEAIQEKVFLLGGVVKNKDGINRPCFTYYKSSANLGEMPSPRHII